ncbi:MAG: thymidine phosphorylase [Oscillospiraceae bacterium]|nr:thymidine phosphorylase [Oscillospiraceae bacterium]
MRVIDLIHKKREGGELTREELQFLVRGYTAGEIPDYQMSAFTMAVYFRGMTDAETACLTEAMMHSGGTVDLSRFGKLSADKHSTGGVGDKTSLIVVPVAASLGCKLAKMSGRGLGHTGGTVDKLESIPGFRTTLDADAFLRQVEEVGAAIVGQSGDLTPADKKLYALRDVTDTVDSIPLIASSIMSKKLASGAHSIVLDVKVGSGAFLKTEAQARKLAEKMVAIGAACGRNVTALLTNMDVPLGYYVGNALEVIEAAEMLKGRGCADLKTVCVELASHLVAMCHEMPLSAARAHVEDQLASGAAFETMKKWIAAQGGDARALDDYSLLPQASVQHEVLAPKDGYIAHMDAQKIGEASSLLGAGRAKKEDPIDYAAGLVLRKKTGDFVQKGEPIAVLHTNDASLVAGSEKTLLSAIGWSPDKPQPQKLILGTVTREGGA